MTKQLRDKWVKALRSGRYKQVRNRLQWSGGNCCLGVLCRVARIPRNDWHGFCALTDEVVEVVGVSDNQHETLVAMNDEEQKSFPQIATWIEANL